MSWQLYEPSHPQRPRWTRSLSSRQARRISSVRSSTGNWEHYWDHYRTRHMKQGPRASAAPTPPWISFSPSRSFFLRFPLLPLAAFTPRIRLWPGLPGFSFLPFSFPFSCCSDRLFSWYPTRSFGNHLRILPRRPDRARGEPRSSRGCYLYER